MRREFGEDLSPTCPGSSGGVGVGERWLPAARGLARSSEKLQPPSPLLPAPPGIYFSLKAPPVSVMLRSPPPPPTGNYWCESPVTFSQASKLFTKKTLGDRAETEMFEKDGLDAERYEI